MPRAHLNEISIHYHEHGDAPPTFLLLNGAALDLQSWGEVGEGLGRIGRVIRFDHRGVGQSDLPRHAYTLVTLAEDALALLDYLHIQQAVVVAHAFGGRIAQILVRDHPERIQVLIICGTGGFYPPDRSPEASKTLSDPVTDRDAWENAYLAQYCGKRFRHREPELAKRVLDEAFSRRSQPLSAEMRRQAIQATPSQMYWGAVPEGVPTLLLYGSEDRFGTAENAEDLASRIPGARLMFIEEAGHMAIRERPDFVLKAISQFCTRQSR